MHDGEAVARAGSRCPRVAFRQRVEQAGMVGLVGHLVCVERVPAAGVIGSAHPELLEPLQKTFSLPSFRAYISGSIANGEWSTEGDLGYATPVFTTDDLTGELALAPLAGTLAVDGAMRFTGHEGILDTTISNLRVELVDFLRPEMKFAGLDQLKAQIAADGAAARTLLADRPAASSQ